MKSKRAINTYPSPMRSPPARGAWIEIPCAPPAPRRCLCRPPHGGRGLKYVLRPPYDLIPSGRPPHGGRGLKLIVVIVACREVESPPARGAWIEIAPWVFPAANRFGRPPHGGRGLKLNHKQQLNNFACRRPPHGGRGLKSAGMRFVNKVVAVAPRTGGVD